MNISNLEKRIREYEQRNKSYLQRKIPVIIRLDMRSGRNFTKLFDRPFDDILIKTMQETAKYLCENIQGAVLSYQQSDEISILLIDYKKLDTSAWFDYEVQKLCSISASMATLAFNRFFIDNVEESFQEKASKLNEECSSDEIDEVFDKLEEEYDRYYSRFNKAMFDSRCFNIPKEEVTNYFYWRQLDATRNSIQMVGQSYFSHKELNKKSCNDIQNMLLTEKDVNWNDYKVYEKRGSCCRKSLCVDEDAPDYMKNNWLIDKNVPIFKGEDREYIDRLVYCEGE